jgi:hypothetical protein
MAKRKHDWASAQKICGLNDDHIEMAKRLGYQPLKLLRSYRPNSRWRIPLDMWIRELHLERFGYVIGEEPLPPIPPDPPLTEEEMKAIEEQIYWEDYFDRNSEPPPKRQKGQKQSPRATTTPSEEEPLRGHRCEDWPAIIKFDITDDDVPF